METYYTSDWHLGHHKLIVEYGKRPFSTTEQMDRAIIDNMKARLRKGDRLYILGDVSFLPMAKAAPLLRELKRDTQAEFYLVPGNHDPDDLLDLRDYDGERGSPRFWKDVSPLMEVRDNRRKVILCHYPMKTWNKSHRPAEKGGAYHLYGHEHGGVQGTTRCMDVGVDPCGFQPLTLDQCIERMKRFPEYVNLHHREDPVA